MKATLNKQSGFSVLEVMCALAFALVVITGALETKQMADYWVITSGISLGARAVAEEQMAAVRLLLLSDFTQVSSTPAATVTASGTVLSDSCIAVGQCYTQTVTVASISSCAKSVAVQVSWSVGIRYPTSSVVLSTYGLHQSDSIARGSDCAIQPLSDGWSSATATRLGSAATSTPAFATGIDVLDDRVYVVASSAPQLRIYEYGPAGTLHLLVSSSLTANRLNAIDVIRDTATGRRYAYIAQHTNTNQLLVLDVTNDTPVITATMTLTGTDSLGSFPQGWRVLVYGNRLYMTTRETAGAELHIFSLTHPSTPTELSAGRYNLARTVNDMAILERRSVDGITHRYLALAASAALKELALFDVTHDVPIERVALDVPGTENALSIALRDNDIYLGRQMVSAGPELYDYDMDVLLAGSTTPRARGEVGADVHTLRPIGPLLIIGTNKSGAELQIWQAGTAAWNPAVAQSGRIGIEAVPRLAPLGVDIGHDTVTTITQSSTHVEHITLWSNL